MAAEASKDTPGGLVNLASLISAIVPTLFGGGTTSQRTSESNVTSRKSDSATNTSTSNTSIDPSVLASLFGISNTAGGNINDPSKTDNVVADIMRQAALSFAPQLSNQAGAGLYNGTTLAGLANEAKARGTAASAKAVLDYKTSQQQVQMGALSTIANNQKSQVNTTTQAADTTQNVSTPASFTTKKQGPAIEGPTLMKTLLNTGGGLIFNQLLKTKTATDLGKSATDWLSTQGDKITNSLGITTNPALPATNTLNALPGEVGQIPTQAADLASGVNAAPITDIPVPPEFVPEALGPVGDAAEAGYGSYATSFADASPTAAGFGSEAADLGANAASLASNFGGSLFTAGVDAASWAASPLTTGVADLAGSAFGAASEAATQGAGLLGALGTGESIFSGVSSAASMGAGALSGSLAGLESAAAPLLAGGAFSFAPMLGPLGILGAMPAFFEGTGISTGVGNFLNHSLGNFANRAVGSVICTELERQGKLDPTLFRYSKLAFASYPAWGIKGYHAWGKPLARFAARYPDSRSTALLAWAFTKRSIYIASTLGYKKKKSSVLGRAITGITCLASGICGGAILLNAFLAPKTKVASNG